MSLSVSFCQLTASTCRTQLAASVVTVKPFTFVRLSVNIKAAPSNLTFWADLTPPHLSRVCCWCCQQQFQGWGHTSFLPALRLHLRVPHAYTCARA